MANDIKSCREVKTQESMRQGLDSFVRVQDEFASLPRAIASQQVRKGFVISVSQDDLGVDKAIV